MEHNTYTLARRLAPTGLIFSALFLFISASPAPPATEPWRLVFKENGLLIYYDLRDCTADKYMLCFKIVNNTGEQKRVAFSAQIANGGSFDSEVFHIIKAVKPYSTELSDCADKGGKSGLMRPLRRTYDDPDVTLTME